MSGVLTGVATGTLTVDRHLTVLGDVILVKNEAATYNDGLYTVSTAGAYVLTRAADMSTAAEFPGAFIPFAGGTANSNTLWLCSATSLVLGASGTVTWTQLNGATDRFRSLREQSVQPPARRCCSRCVL